MNKIAFYLMNKKGFIVLENFIKQFGNKYITYVVSYEDPTVKKDFYTDIEKLCKKNNIRFYNKNVFTHKEIGKIWKIAIGWKWIIEDNRRLIVLHDSLLPKYRGFAPLVNMLINKENTIGVSAIRGVSEYDKGDIITQKSITIVYPIKIQEAINVISKLYIDVVDEVYQMILNNKFSYSPQDESQASYSVWRDEADYSINWNQTASDIQRFVDAVGYPYRGASTFAHGKKIRIINVEIIDDVKVEHRENNLGKIIFMIDELPVVICKKGLIKLVTILDDVTGNTINDKINFRTRFEANK